MWSNSAARLRHLSLFLMVGLLSACATGGHLSDRDRESLRDAAVIHVLHYQSSLPRIEPRSKRLTPTAVRSHASADPAALVAQSFGQLLAKKEKLKNLRVEQRNLPLPVAKDARLYRDKLKHGLALELWTDNWSFVALPADPQTFSMSLVVRSRLARIEDGRVLWSTGRCSVDGINGHHELRLAGTELTQGVKLRKLLAAARDECTRQLLRDFSSRLS